MILVFISCENKEDADKLANHLIDEKLAACVSVFPVGSYYYWEGKKVKSDECELIAKTTEEKFSDLENAVEHVLSYTTPQIIKVDSKGSSKYESWVKKQVEQ